MLPAEDYAEAVRQSLRWVPTLGFQYPPTLLANSEGVREAPGQP